MSSVQITFLNGSELLVPITDGDMIADVRHEICKARAPPPGKHPALLHEGQVLEDGENASTFVDVPLSCIYTFKPLTSWAAQFMKHCTHLDPKEDVIELLEINVEVKHHDLQCFAEVLEALQPRHFLVGTSVGLRVLPEGGWDTLSSCLPRGLINLESIRLYDIASTDVAHFAKFLQKCPKLFLCDLLTSKNLSLSDAQQLQGSVLADFVLPQQCVPQRGCTINSVYRQAQSHDHDEDVWAVLGGCEA